jgi:hypothetical protein
MCTAKHFDAPVHRRAGQRLRPANAHFQARSLARRSDFFSELQDAIREKNKIRLRQRRLIDRGFAIPGLAPTDGM